MKNSEHLEQVALFQWAASMQSRYPALGNMFAIPNAGGYTGGYKANMLRAMKMKREGVKRGVPDIFLAWPKFPKNGLFIEMKSSKGKVSPEQMLWRASLLRVGYEVNVCYSWVTAAQVICEYLGMDDAKAQLR